MLVDLLIDSGVVSEEEAKSLLTIEEQDRQVAYLDELAILNDEIMGGIDRATASKLIDKKILNPNRFIPEMFGSFKSDTNISICQQGLFSATASVISAIFATIAKIVVAVIKLITFPFRWALGMTGGSSSTGGHGGGSGGGAVDSKVARKARDLQKKAKDLVETAEKMGLNSEVTLKDLTDEVRETLGNLESDPGGLGNIFGVTAFARKKLHSLPIGLKEALEGENELLKELGFRKLDGINPARVVDVVQAYLIGQVTDGYDTDIYLKTIENAFVFNASMFRNPKDFTDFRGTRAELTYLLNTMAGYEVARTEGEGPMTNWNPKLGNSPDATNAFVISWANQVPFFEPLGKFMREKVASYNNLLDATGPGEQLSRDVEAFMEDPIWERMKEEVVRLTDGGQYPSRLDVRNKSNWRYLIGNDEHLQGNIMNLYDVAAGYALKDEHTSQVSAILANYYANSIGGDNAIERFAGFNFDHKSPREREELKINDPRLSAMFARIKSKGGEMELDFGVELITMKSRLEDLKRSIEPLLINQANKDLYYGLINRFIATVNDRIKAKTAITKLLQVLSAHWHALMVAVYTESSRWMIDCQRAAVALAALKIVQSMDPENIFKTVEQAAGTKLTEEEKDKVRADLVVADPYQMVLPINAMQLVLDKLVKASGDKEAAEKAVARLAPVYIKANENRMETLRKLLTAEYLDATKRSASEIHLDFARGMMDKLKLERTIKKPVRVTGNDQTIIPFPEFEEQQRQRWEAMRKTQTPEVKADIQRIMNENPEAVNRLKAATAHKEKFRIYTEALKKAGKDPEKDELWQLLKADVEELEGNELSTRAGRRFFRRDVDPD